MALISIDSVVIKYRYECHNLYNNSQCNPRMCMFTKCFF